MKNIEHWFIVSYDSATKHKKSKEPSRKKEINCQWILENIGKYRVALCNIGLVKYHGGHLINQPCLSLFERCWKTKGGYQISTVIKNKQT